jgi:hypothetical protein
MIIPIIIGAAIATAGIAVVEIVRFASHVIADRKDRRFVEAESRRYAERLDRFMRIACERPLTRFGIS